MCFFLRFFFIVVISFSLNAMLPLLANKSEYSRYFQTRGPAALKAMSLKLVCVRLMRSVRESAERSRVGQVSRREYSCQIGRQERRAQTTPSGLKLLIYVFVSEDHQK